jgi:hypothetical protein
MENSKLPNREPNWEKLNEYFHDRLDSMNRFNEGLAAKRNKTFGTEEGIKEFNEKRSRFQELANRYFDEWLLASASLSGQEDLIDIGGYPGEGKEIFKSINISYSKWKGLPEQEFNNEAYINFNSTLPYGPFGFNVKLVFSVKTNPATYAQEFRLTAFGGSDTELPSEREKQTLIIHRFKTEEDWATIGYKTELTSIEERWPLIEKEMYYFVFDNFIRGDGMKTYRNVDFLMSTRLPK